MSLKERIKKLAQERGISLPALESELGFGNSTIVKWDKSTPNADKLNAVAKYFGVSMDYLLNGTDEDGLTEKDEKDIAKDVDRIMEKLSSGEAGPASYDGEELDPEAAELFRDELEIALRRLKLINKEKYTPKKYKK
ncbi:MAG: helix-turn-helix transcriptional regulator [bacterium]|nr:helix-turn-helix transcriptional regulator [bacterium]